MLLKHKLNRFTPYPGANAAGDTKAFRNFLANQATATNSTAFGTDNISLYLLTSSYTPNYTGDQYGGSITTNEVTAGTAYTSGGISISAVSITVSGSFAILKFADISIAQDASGFNAARWGVIYEKTGVGTTSQLIATIDLGTDISNTAGPITIAYTANKVLKWQY